MDDIIAAGPGQIWSEKAQARSRRTIRVEHVDSTFAYATVLTDVEGNPVPDREMTRVHLDDKGRVRNYALAPTAQP